LRVPEYCHHTRTLIGRNRHSLRAEAQYPHYFRIRRQLENYASNSFELC